MKPLLPVIQSAVNGSRSEAFTERRTPYRSPFGTDPSGSFHHARQHSGNSLKCPSLRRQARVLRLRGLFRFANPPTPLSMTDASSIRSHCPEFLGLSFPKMLLTTVSKSCHPEWSEAPRTASSSARTRQGGLTTTLSTVGTPLRVIRYCTQATDGS